MMKSSKGFQSSFVGGMIAVTIYLVLISPYLYYRYAPREYFFDYEAIIPHTAQVGEPLEFVSIRQVNRDSDFEAQEDMICKVNGEYKQVRERSIPYTTQKTEGYVNSYPWEYPYVPTVPGECFIESNIKIKLPFGIKRSQFVVAHFEVGN